MAICYVSLILSRCGVPPSTPPAGSPTRRRGKKSLLIRRDPTLRISGAPAGGISQSSTCICLPAEASAQAGPFLSNLEKMTFQQPVNKLGAWVDPPVPSWASQPPRLLW